MNEFRRWLAGIMYGRYGTDELNRVLLYASLICVVVGIFFARRIMNILVVVLLAICYYRTFSKNIYKRQEELNKYLQFKYKFFGKSRSANVHHGSRSAGTGRGFTGFGGRRNSGAGSRSMRIFICPYCKGKLRVPVGAGRIRIKCPHCGREFEEVV